MNALTPDEIKMIQATRQKTLDSRSNFMALANQVCTMMEIPFSAVCGASRGSPDVCKTRALICRIAFDRGYHPALIARFIRRDRTTVIHAISTTKTGNPVLQSGGEDD